ncbi:MAG: SDR family oxidoreductase, partial [Firmicutes bacterium]|nr:SDR family oxidoreductase [Bacillota bacterium]
MPAQDGTAFKLTTSCRTALVTGASRGIGRGAALALAELGCNVAVNYRSAAGEAGDVVAEIEALGRRAVAIQADVADAAQVEAMVERAERDLGPIDCLVVNAAFSIRKPWVEHTLEEITHTLNVSLFGAIHASHAVGRRMVARRTAGRVVFISSLHAEAPFAICAAN